MVFLFFFKQNAAYEMRISDWSSDVCSSDLAPQNFPAQFDSWAMPLSPQDIEHRLKLFNPDGDFERRLAKTWELAGDIMAPVTERFWNSIKQQIGRASCRERVCQYV